MAVPTLKTTVPPNASDPQQVRQSILGIRKDLEELRSQIVAMSGTIYWNETTGGAINGSNTAFTLAHAPSPSTALLLFLNGLLLTAGGDFTISGANITMATAPLTGDILRATYKA